MKILTLLFLCCAIVPALAQTGRTNSGLTDSLDVSVRGSESAHAQRSGGATLLEIAGDSVGGHDMRRMTRKVTGAGNWVSYRLRVQPNVPVTLEVEEIENRAPAGQSGDVRGYSLWVDGERAFFRTAQSSGAGPLHYFVQVPPRRANTLEIKLQNETDTPFHLARIWAFSDFNSYFQKSGMAVPYYLAPTLRLGFGDFEGDRKKLQTLKDSFGAHPHARPAWTTWLAYTNNSDADNALRIAYILRLAESLDLPVQICFDTWWGSTPNGSDGEGNFWTDVQYQQVVYNQTTRTYGLSVPNRWGNTPWLSVDNPRLNAYKARRLQTAMQMLQEQRTALRARGKENLILAVNLDNEPVYWATGNAGLGNDILQADFNASTIEAARRDKIALDPTDGLDFSERLWLARNLLNYHELIGSAASAGAGPDPIVVDGRGVHFPSEFISDNIYTQGMVANPVLQYPLQSATYPFWETAAPASARIGSEWNGDSLREREAVLHQLPLGRTAQVNAESGGKADEMIGVRPGYALGLRYYALYNYPLDKMEVATSEIREASSSVTPFTYERVLREESFAREDWPTRVVATRGLQRGLIGNTTLQALYPTPDSNSGWLIYRLDAPQNVFEGLNLELSGRAFVSRDRNPNVFIRVLAGEKNDVASMREAGRIFDSGDINAVHKVDLSATARGQKAVYVRIELHADKLPATVLSWSAIYHLRFTLPWPAPLWQTAFAQNRSLATQRSQNLLVSWRRDAELALEQLAHHINSKSTVEFDRTLGAKAAGELAAARAAYANAHYAQAYRKARIVKSWLLPGATYRVETSGRLEPYPLAVQTTAPLTVKLQQWNEKGIAFSLHSEKALSPSLQFSALKPGTAYVLQRAAPQSAWLLRPMRGDEDKSGVTLRSDKEGALECRVQVPAETKRDNSPLTGTYRGILETTPNAVFAMWRDDGNGTQRITLQPNAIISRGNPGHPFPAQLDQLQRGDAVTIQFAEDGIAAHVTAETQTFEGRVQEFGSLTPYAMPFVQLEGSPTRYVIDLNAVLSLTDSGGVAITPTFRSAQPGTIKIQKGDYIKVRLNPRTGRVFELVQTRAPTP